MPKIGIHQMMNSTGKAALLAALLLGGGAFGVHAQTDSGKAGTGSVAGAAADSGSAGSVQPSGSAGTGDSNAAALGTGGNATRPTGSGLATGGADAAKDEAADSRTKIHDNRNTLMGQSKAMPKEGGEEGGGPARVPGAPPSLSTTPDSADPAR